MQSTAYFKHNTSLHYSICNAIPDTGTGSEESCTVQEESAETYVTHTEREPAWYSILTYEGDI